ncbi:Syntaxin-61 [Zea mays]|uniref:Syntaxin-61 n=1 Tax=Zea mays TaxID=4577 RepID=A0A3L6FLE9_MAIZE|nr:Syntaxin-61 [Zea mays]
MVLARVQTSKVDELEKTISVASRDPSYYGLDEVELSRRRNWTGSAHKQELRITNEVGTVKRAIEKGKSNVATSKYQDTSRTNHYSAQDNDDFISSESDRQLLLMRNMLPVQHSSIQHMQLRAVSIVHRQQDEELDELSESVQRIGGVGLTIHEELSGQELLPGIHGAAVLQERILNDLSLEMETTSNRLDFVQKRVAMVMKKAGIKGQIMLIVFLVVLFIILFVLVFLT